MLPKPLAGKLPVLITGGSQQDPDWLAANGNGWMTYPRNLPVQERIVTDYRERVRRLGGFEKPVMQPLYLDLCKDADAPAELIHLGFRAGIKALRDHLKALESIGVNHVALNLRFNSANIETTLKRLAGELLPDFSE